MKTRSSESIRRRMPSARLTSASERSRWPRTHKPLPLLHVIGTNIKVVYAHWLRFVLMTRPAGGDDNKLFLRATLSRPDVFVAASESSLGDAATIRSEPIPRIEQQQQQHALSLQNNNLSTGRRASLGVERRVEGQPAAAQTKQITKLVHL